MHEAGSRETAVVADGPPCASSATASRTTSSEGDAVTFDADLPHHFENPGRREAQFMSVIAAGLRRS